MALRRIATKLTDATRKLALKSKPKSKASARPRSRLVIITGISGSGKASVLKAFEDLGYYCVDNLPVELMPQFAELIRASEDRNAALVVDIREGTQLEQLPRFINEIKKQMNTTVVYLDADDSILVRRFSETRRPHPLGQSESVQTSLQDE